ncbi:MAG: phage tail assembly chaperone [Sphingomonas fennica]
MSDATFAASAARLAGVAGAVAGWRPDDFWRATPAELAAVLTALAGPGAAAPACADDLRRLLAEHPDG